MARCCLGIIDVLLREFDDLTGLDRWLLEFDRCRTIAGDGAELPVAVLVARLWRDFSHPSLRRPAEDFEPIGARAVVRAIARMLDADSVRSGSILRSTLASHDPDVSTQAAAALGQVLDGEPAQALEAARAGLAIALANGTQEHDAWLHLLCAAAALGLDDLDAARHALELAETASLRRGDRAFLHLLQSWLASASGNAGLALREARASILLAVEAGIPWAEALARLAAVQLLAAAGERQSAPGQMRAAAAVAERTGSALLRLSTLLTQAGSALLCDDEDDAVEPLREGLALARELGAHHVPGLQTALLGRLCACALRRGIAVEHTRLLIGAAHVAPPADALRLRQWPWAFEVTMFGSFRLQRAGEPIEFSAKGPGRPVELLKLLVSLGGSNVRVEQLADSLWPHVDADYAHQSFTATLHRLRRILGGEDTLKLRDGRLSLNGSLFWLDIWALDEVLSAIDTLLRETSMRAADEPLRVLLEEALSLYRGPFLADEAEHSSYVARREQLRGKLLRTLARIARHLESAGHGEDAVDAYLRFIDADEQCEAFYRNLMLCYQRLGDRAEALATYERLKTVLAAASRSEPAPETRAIQTSLLG